MPILVDNVKNALDIALNSTKQPLIFISRRNYLWVDFIVKTLNHVLCIYYYDHDNDDYRLYGCYNNPQTFNKVEIIKQRMNRWNTLYNLFREIARIRDLELDVDKIVNVVSLWEKHGVPHCYCKLRVCPCIPLDVKNICECGLFKKKGGNNG